MTSNSDRVRNAFFDRMPHERRAFLRWAMMAGGAALAGVTRNSQVFAGGAQAKEEKAQAAVETCDARYAGASDQGSQGN